jgi:hypothetical protein
MKQTAMQEHIEWLKSTLEICEEHAKPLISCLNLCIAHAESKLKIEKEQIMQAFGNGKINGDKNWAHRYYKETFKSEI